MDRDVKPDPIRTRTQSKRWAEETTANDKMSWVTAWLGPAANAVGWGAFKKAMATASSTIRSSIGKKIRCAVGKSDNAESIFGHLLTLTIADTFTPLEWETYIHMTVSARAFASLAFLAVLCGRRARSKRSA